MKSYLLFLLLQTFLVFGESQKIQNCDYEYDIRTYFCKNIIDVFPNAYYDNFHLKCVDCNIRTFSNTTFPFTNNLVSFNVSASHIKYITRKAFSTLSNVQYIYLQNNDILEISPEAFWGLRQVYEVHLEYNQINILVPGFLSGLESSTVTLNNNKIKILPDRAFEGSLSILILDLSNNLIKTIGPDAFVGLDVLEVLHLEKNKICHLPLGVFKHLSTLKQLNLADNNLSKFSVGTFSGLKNLNSLNLANNTISVFDPTILIAFSHLSTLDISGNGMYYFDAHALYINAPTLRAFSLDDNLLSCTQLLNVIQYFRKNRVDVVNMVGRYDVQNINGIACTEQFLSQSIDFEAFLKGVKEDTKKAVVYC